MHLNECEVAHRHIRGHNAIFIFGPRALTPDECAALAAEYAASYGAMDRPAYLSPAGWQLLEPPKAAAPSHEPPVTTAQNVVEPAAEPESVGTAQPIRKQRAK